MARASPLKITGDRARPLTAMGHGIGASVRPTMRTSPRTSQVTTWPWRKRGVVYLPSSWTRSASSMGPSLLRHVVQVVSQTSQAQRGQLLGQSEKQELHSVVVWDAL